MFMEKFFAETFKLSQAASEIEQQNERLPAWL